MNALTNKIPFGLLSENEKMLFIQAGRGNLMFYDPNESNCGDSSGLDKGWHICAINNDDLLDEMTYRLKLVDGKWYTERHIHEYYTTYLYKDGTFYLNGTKETGNTIGSGSGYEAFRPATQKEIERVKPKDYIDVELDWRPYGEPTVKHPNDAHWTLNALGIGCPVKGWALAGYKFKESGDVIKDRPVKFNKGTDRTSIRSKATHARFIKMEINK